MISVATAKKIVRRETKRLGIERIALANSVGRVLAESIIADSDMPPFDRSQMDGYAVKAKDTENCPFELKIVGESAAGRGWKGTLKKGEAVRIMTGAPVPNGADAVQKIELTREAGGAVTIIEPTSKGRFIVPRGSEIKKGKAVLRTGEIMTANSIAVLAAFGYARVKVAKHPRVTIFSTGSEIVEINKRPKQDQIRNSNSVMLASLCRAAGADVTVLPIAGDEIADLKARIADAVKKADILVTTGGVSVGKYDLTKAALIELGADIFFERLRLKPGKPTVFAGLKKTLIFGLPGNPVSAAVTFYLFVRNAILLKQSAADAGLAGGFAVVEDDVKGTKERESYLPAVLGTDAQGRLIAFPIRWHGSSDFIGFSAADALVIVPEGGRLAAGETASVLFLP
jgi:molybdopterin molybdotransferase